MKKMRKRIALFFALSLCVSVAGFSKKDGI